MILVIAHHIYHSCIYPISSIPQRHPLGGKEDPRFTSFFFEESAILAFLFFFSFPISDALEHTALGKVCWDVISGAILLILLFRGGVDFFCLTSYS